MSEFLSGLESSGWLRHIKAVMDAGIFIAKVIIKILRTFTDLILGSLEVAVYHGGKSFGKKMLLDLPLPLIYCVPLAILFSSLGLSFSLCKTK